MYNTILKPETVYHIYTHANGFENLFNCEENYRYFLHKYSEHIYPVSHTYAYCLMPNHLHLMVKIRSKKEVLEYVQKKHPKRGNLQGFQNPGGFSNLISQQFSNLFNGYTKAYNNMYDRKGSLFIPNFKRKEVEDELYMTKLIVYFHNNPIHHGFTNSLTEWKYSSFQTYLSANPSKIDRQYLKGCLGNKEELIRFHTNEQLPMLLKMDS